MTRLAKRFLMTFIVLISFNALLSAQQYQEVVYLKNGSVIRGMVIEQIPDKNLTVRTSDGSTIICDMDDVAKITKEICDAGKKSSRRMEYGWVSSPRYRGFVEESFVIGTGEVAFSRAQISTSHGCQINPYLYAGGGLGINYWTDTEDGSFPVFAHVRSEFHKALNKRVSPFAEEKIGDSVGNVEGFYCRPEAGCHIYFGKTKLGLSISVGYEVQMTDVYYYQSGITMYQNVGGVSISAAFDF